MKELLGKNFINLIYLSKFLARLYYKQTYKGVIFSNAAYLFLAALLKKNGLPHIHFSLRADILQSRSRTLFPELGMSTMKPCEKLILIKK